MLRNILILGCLWLLFHSSLSFIKKPPEPSYPAQDIYVHLDSLARNRNLDLFLIYRLIKLESNWDASAISNKQAYGLTQVQLYTAKMIDPAATINKLLDPFYNAVIGLDYLVYLREEFGSLRQALIAYNMGPGRMKELNIKNSSYAERIMGK